MVRRIFARIFRGPGINPDQLMKPVRPPYVVTYLLVGLFLGGLFPISATTYEIVSKGLTFSLATIGVLHRTEPLLWMVDTAPLFLGVYALVLGLREDVLRKTYINLVTERENISELQSLTQQLERRTNQLKVVAQLSEQLSVTENLSEQLHGMLEHFRANFGFYHAMVYLTDDAQNKLVLAEATGSVGRELKSLRHAIPLEMTDSLPVRAVHAREAIWADNVREIEGWQPNPLLPHVYSEMSVPIVVDDRVLGVLDVLESRIAAFDDGDASIMTIMAMQLASTIRNVRVFEEVEAALQRAQALQNRYQQQVWDRNRIARRNRGIAVYRQPDLPPLSEETIARGRRQALTRERPTEVAVPAEGRVEQALVAPVKIGDVLIGNLQLYGKSGAASSWTDDDIQFVEAVIDQVAQAADNLRLFEETQERANRERLITEIGEKMRRAADMDTLMRVTTAELSRVLGGARTFVKLGSAERLAGETGTPPDTGDTPPLSPPDSASNGRMNGTPPPVEKE